MTNGLLLIYGEIIAHFLIYILGSPSFLPDPDPLRWPLLWSLLLRAVSRWKKTATLAITAVSNVAVPSILLWSDHPPPPPPSFLHVCRIQIVGPPPLSPTASAVLLAPVAVAPRQDRAVAKSYMTNGLLIYGEIFAHVLIYILGSPSFNCSPLNFLIYEENLIFFFYQCRA